MSERNNEAFSVSVFGNPDLSSDSVPVQLVPNLRIRFPHARFVIEDPNEIDLPKRGKWVILDTVRGLEKVSWLSVDDIARSRNAGMTAHDYDLSTLLLLAKKLDPSFEPNILGVPESMSEEQALPDVIRELATVLR
ncbi:MAG: hypothetical protein IPK84_02330 [Candidatus Moraniibacteriota bacterium]|nr:MAG: hypothetical protein IPK84_02330 [Candidatus Moranbacteria bacterium]